MKAVSRRTVLVAIVAVLAAAGLFVLGRASASRTAAGSAAATEASSYFQGLQAGEAQGRQEGRALAIGDSVPAESRQPVEDAFNAGYTAGLNDAFAGYDGGWTTGVPYVVTLQPGGGKITYRIGDRAPLQVNVNYYLCPNGRDLCQEPRK